MLEGSFDPKVCPKVITDGIVKESCTQDLPGSMPSISDPQTDICSEMSDTVSLSEKSPKKKQTTFNKKNNRSSLVAVSFPPKDIRNTYADAFFEASNSGDSEVISRILTSMCTEDVKLICKFKIPDNHHALEDVEVNGLPALIAMVGSMVATSPDAVLFVVKKEVEVFHNGESVIIATWALKCTMLYSINGFESGCKDKIVVTASSTNSTNTGSTEDSLNESMNSLEINATVKKKMIDPLTNNLVEVEENKSFGLGERRGDNVKMEWTATTTFYVNKEKKIYLIVSEK